MQKSNFALISALYSSKDAGLYKDIYFPIIKYSIVCLFYSDKKQEYYNLEDVQNFIIQEFGIKIPLIVLKKSVVLLKESKEITLTIYESGEYFQIKQVWDHEVNVNIDQRTSHFSQSIDLLEQKYTEYKKTEELEDERTFLDFITDNCDDILGFFDKNDISKVDEKYTIMAYFLEYLQKTDADLFNTANELFWGSIIAGFLKRENPDSEKVSDSDRQEYFLDTPLVMALLDLSTEESKAYAEELLDIIVNSGCIARIHPMTLREISNIIQSVEVNTCPRPNTPIAFAYERRGLNAAKLANIRVNLSTNLDRMKISEMPSLSSHEIDKTINVYKKKIVVLELAKKRGDNRSGDDTMREAHDIFMYDFIRERRKNDKNAFFVTHNSDLINFCRSIHENTDFGFITPNKIVLEMWMHNSGNIDVKGKALTQTMARCLVLNNRDIRHKLNVVSRFYNDSQKEFNPEAYRAIILGLYKRDKELITSIDELKNQDNQEVNETNRQEMVKIAEHALSKENKRKSRLANIQDQLAAIQKDNADIKSMMALTESKKQTAENQIVTLTEKTKQQETVISLLQRNENLRKELDKKEKRLNSLDTECSKSISYKRYYLLLSLPIIGLFIFSSLIYVGYLWNETIIPVGIIGDIVSLLLFVLSWVEKYAFNFKEIKRKVEDSQKTQWIQEHPEYSELKDEIEELRNEIKENASQIRNFDNS